MKSMVMHDGFGRLESPASAARRGHAWKRPEAIFETAALIHEHLDSAAIEAIEAHISDPSPLDMLCAES